MKVKVFIPESSGAYHNHPDYPDEIEIHRFPDALVPKKMKVVHTPTSSDGGCIVLVKSYRLPLKCLKMSLTEKVIFTFEQMLSEGCRYFYAIVEYEGCLMYRGSK